MSEDNGARVALLVDGENISSAYAGKLITEAGKFGPLVIKRVYGNVSQINGWGSAPGLKVMHAGAGKNAADILLAIEAVQLFHDRKANVFVIASSDGDFTHVATHLREQGCQVYGSGEIKAPEAFRKSCTGWVMLEGKPAERDERIRQLIAARSEGFLIGQVSPEIRKRLAITLSNLPEKTWRAYFEVRKNSYAITGTGQETRITAL
ncbi:NYN domain-containing protein [Thalassovita sp.]|uniref:NYN domain-containing protein n=1 Tax=Thalassovita sp. TaxID=1979401 RepID=UPI0029DE7237|nr:NYN domain-containing protein [Thalassovita sp.]